MKKVYVKPELPKMQVWESKETGCWFIIEKTKSYWKLFSGSNGRYNFEWIKDIEEEFYFIGDYN